MAKNGSGIYERHARSCPAGDTPGAKCNCTPTYQVKVYSRRDRKRISKTFRTRTEAKQWQSEAKVEIRKGTRRAAGTQTVGQALEELLDGIKGGAILTNKRTRYKPNTIRRYDAAVHNVLIPRFGGRRLADLTRPDLLSLVEEFAAEGRSGQDIANTLIPLGLLYRRAMARGELGLDLTKGLEMPRLNGPRDQVVSEDEAARLIAAAHENDRGIWATAFYAGLRVGEVQGLNWENVDAGGWLNVERSYDERDGGVRHEPKTPAGVRRVPILDRLRPFIEWQWETSAKTGPTDPVFYRWSDRTRPETCMIDGCNLQHRARGLCENHYAKWQRGTLHDLPVFEQDNRPFYSLTVQERADKAWKAAGLERVTFHVCRHTFASILFARRVSPTLIQSWMGHASLKETLDTYVKLIPGSEVEGLRLANEQLPAEMVVTEPRLALQSGE